MTDVLKIALVDDQSLCRRGLSELLANCYDFNVLGAVGTVEELRPLLDQKPDLVAIDLRMKPMGGLEMLEQIRKEGYDTPAIILTMSDSETDMGSAIRAGARGYLLKDMAPEDVVDAIRRVAAGHDSQNDQHVTRRSTWSGTEKFVQVTHRARARDIAVAVARREQQSHRADAENQLRHGETACPPHIEQAQPVFTGKSRCSVRQRTGYTG